MIDRRRRKCVPLTIALSCLTVFCSGLFAAEENGPAPQWIWTSKSAAQGEMAYFRKVFEIQGTLKSAVLQVASDDNVSVFVNGEQVLEHSTWQSAAREDITKRLAAGKNVVALRGKNNGGPGAMLAYLVIETDKGKQFLVSDPSWLAKDDPAENWRVVDYDDSTWKPAVSLGKLGVAPWGVIAIGGRAPPPASATAEETIDLPEGFRIELLYSVPKESQGSWVSMTPDDKGRLIVSDQYGGLYRVTPGSDAESTKVEPLSVAIGDSQGMLYVHDSLYVTVNGGAAQGSGLYRVRDTNGDDQFDEVKLLKKLRGGGEHGPHGIRLGPDGMLYVIAGNHTEIPEGVAEDSPHRNYAEDLLLPRNPDGNGHATGRMAPGGWIARTDKDGQRWELFCAGFRNPYDIDFNQDGELFTYDADMEWDTGTPWYRPTRVNHCTSAAEFGWRFGTGKWPDYYADSLGSVVDIGLGSPTGISFGTGAKFPARYQQALFINDWTYGKIYAVHMTPRGAGYTATFETFAQGRPLPVTDVVVNQDGALYFTIGGRRTQSGLYRVTYVGDEPTSPASPVVDADAAKARELRRRLEAFHRKRDPQAIDIAWPHLNSPDRTLRYAARVAIERQEPQVWADRALQETRTTASIYALLALIRAGDPALQGKIVARLNELPYQRMSEEQLLAAIRAYGLSFIRQGKPSGELAGSVIARVSPLFPSQSEAVNRELCGLLVYLNAPETIERSLKLLASSQTQQDQLHYVLVLRNVADQMSADQARAFFSWCNLAETSYRGGNSFKKFVAQIRRDAVAKLSSELQKSLADVIEGKMAVEVVKLETTRQFIHNWQLDDLEPMLEQVESGRSFERGRAVYQAAQCAKCHRFAGDGGDTGPDITGVGARFTPQYLLESLITPSKAVSDQYVNTVIATGDGEVITGRVVSDDGKTLKVRTDPFALTLTEIAKDNIEAQRPSPVSEMPQGLVNVLTKEEIIDLIAYLRSAGDAADRAFQK